MTVTDLSPTLIRRRVRAEVESTPESDRVAELRRMLDDPRWSADTKEIREAIDYLTAPSALAA